ncbi:MAG TPA: hypothetical protein VFQ85_00550 [Mycobacteriales bacterium]|jgi:hypothetical protein|nr:hypothetical protein [Mycobacteriales bacterium]
MSEFERALRAAVADETATVTAPPYGGLARRLARRRTERVLAAAAAVVTLAGGVAVAAQRDEGARLRPAATPALKPFFDLREDKDAQLAVGACMTARGYRVPKEGLWVLYSGSSYSDADPKLVAFPGIYDECLAASGYGPSGEVEHVARMHAQHEYEEKCREFRTNLAATTLVASGEFRAKRWTVHAVAHPDGENGFCLFESYGGKNAGAYVNPQPREGAPSQLGPALAEAIVAGVFPSDWLFAGAVDPRAASVRGVVNGHTYTARVVRVPGVDDRVFYAFAAEVAQGPTMTYGVTALDADGNVVGVDKATTVPLH